MCHCNAPLNVIQWVKRRWRKGCKGGWFLFTGFMFFLLPHCSSPLLFIYCYPSLGWTVSRNPVHQYLRTFRSNFIIFYRPLCAGDFNPNPWLAPAAVASYFSVVQRIFPLYCPLPVDQQTGRRSKRNTHNSLALCQSGEYVPPSTSFGQKWNKTSSWKDASHSGWKRSCTWWYSIEVGRGSECFVHSFIHSSVQRYFVPPDNRSLNFIFHLFAATGRQTRQQTVDIPDVPLRTMSLWTWVRSTYILIIQKWKQ